MSPTTPAGRVSAETLVALREMAGSVSVRGALLVQMIDELEASRAAPVIRTEPATLVAIKDMPLGARFRYFDTPGRVYVLLENYGSGKCAEWRDDAPLGWRGQGLYSIVDGGNDVRELMVVMLDGPK